MRAPLSNKKVSALKAMLREENLKDEKSSKKSSKK